MWSLENPCNQRNPNVSNERAIPYRQCGLHERYIGLSMFCHCLGTRHLGGIMHAQIFAASTGGRGMRPLYWGALQTVQLGRVAHRVKVAANQVIPLSVLEGNHRLLLLSESCNALLKI